MAFEERTLRPGHNGEPAVVEVVRTEYNEFGAPMVSKRTEHLTGIPNGASKKSAKKK